MKLLSLILLFLFSFTCFAQKSPSSVSVVTASYTIPAKKYARVIVNLEGSATFTVNGTLAMRGVQYSILGSSGLKYVTFSLGTRTGLATINYDNANIVSDVLAFTSSTAMSAITQEVYLPAGAIINGTGTWRAIVELYER